jgi:cellulose synthase/poly-beta-1,6-N-acetylglucosamine synthase-like glycosyltransferase
MKYGHLRKFVLYTLLYFVTAAIFASTVLFVKRPIENSDFSIVRLIIIAFATVLLLKYTFYMLVSPWFEYLTAQRRKQLPNLIHHKPLVSVIIPAWNEEVGLLTTVKTLLESSYHNLEIVVINDGSTDGSDQMMRSFIAKYERETHSLLDRIHLIYYYQQNGGKGSALNSGIKLAHGDIVMSIDADCVVDRHAVRNFVRAFADPRVMAAVGNVKIGNTQTLVGAIQHLEYLFSFYFKKGDSLLNTIYIIGGAAGAFRKEVFQRLGGYSTKNITEDIELSIRIQEAGMRIAYVPDAVIYTEGASNVRDLMKQRLRWKRGRFETFREHKALFFSTKPHHNKLLTWFILPLAVFGDVQLAFELPFILILYIYSVATHDFSTFVSGILIVSLIFFIQLVDERRNGKPFYLLLAPIGWLLFYLTTIVEVNALLKSLWGILCKQDLKWQKWQRKGVRNS